MSEKMVQSIGEAIARQLADSIERLLNAATDQETPRSVTWSATLAFKYMKKQNRVRVRVIPRERIPLPGLELDFAISDDKQLSLLDSRAVAPSTSFGANEDEAQVEQEDAEEPGDDDEDQDDDPDGEPFEVAREIGL